MPRTTVITTKTIDAFHDYLFCEEMSKNTILKYLRDVRDFAGYLDGQSVSKKRVLGYKESLGNRELADSSVNSMLSSVRTFLRFTGRTDCTVRGLRVQEMPFSPDEKSLSLEEYFRLLEVAEGDQRLHLILQVLAGTGIRVSELQYFTVENFRDIVENVHVNVRCKKKSRRVLVAGELTQEVLRYIEEKQIESGPIFCTRSGKPLDRSNLWKQMKRLCEKACVDPEKVFPHNLRKLFARVFYEQTRDIVQLSCLLGHSSINTTKIYVRTTEGEVRGKVEDVVQTIRPQKNKNTTLSA